MTLTQQIFAVSLAVIFLVVVLELVRRRKLKIEYSILWIFTALLTCITVIWYDPLVYFAEFIGAGLPKNIVFIFGILFLLLLNLHFSVKLSQQSEMIKNLSQKLTMNEAQSSENDK